jgi:hypothetical protein
MHPVARSLVAILAMCGVVTADEVLTLTVASPDDQTEISSKTLTVGEGEWAELNYSHPNANCYLDMVKDGIEFQYRSESVGRLKVEGPATFRLRANRSGRGFATFLVHRVTNSTPVAAIPAEPGNTFQVVMESSADLVNWTTAAPGAYPATEPKRFFRVRIERQ